MEKEKTELYKKVCYCLIILLIIGFIGSFCNNNSSKNNNVNIYNNINITSDKITESSFLDTFISDYNNSNMLAISNCENFTANDKTSPYYRTEFRLSAFKNARCIHGTVKNCGIDMVDYTDQLYDTKHKQFRVYINSTNINEIKEIGSIVIKMLDSTILDEEIQEAYNSISGSFYLGNYIKRNYYEK